MVERRSDTARTTPCPRTWFNLHPRCLRLQPHTEAVIITCHHKLTTTNKELSSLNAFRFRQWSTIHGRNHRNNSNNNLTINPIDSCKDLCHTPLPTILLLLCLLKGNANDNATSHVCEENVNEKEGKLSKQPSNMATTDWVHIGDHLVFRITFGKASPCHPINPWGVRWGYPPSINISFNNSNHPIRRPRGHCHSLPRLRGHNATTLMTWISI